MKESQQQLIATAGAPAEASRQHHHPQQQPHTRGTMIPSVVIDTATVLSVSGGDGEILPPLSDNNHSVSFVGKQLVRLHHFKAGVETWFDQFGVVVALAAWYVVGVLAIVTTKLLLQDWRCPPLVLTVQQLAVGTSILRIVLSVRDDGGATPWPWCPDDAVRPSPTTTSTSPAAAVALVDRADHAGFVADPRGVRRTLLLPPWLLLRHHHNFILAGVFNSLDFLASNVAFSFSSAHFVETIKASEPITTTAIALLWKVDRLSGPEAGSLSLLICGILLSTWGNSTDARDVTDEKKLAESIQTATLALSANIFFGFRAINQKKYRSMAHESDQMDDVNFLCRMQQVGATFLIGPLLLLHYDAIAEALGAPLKSQVTYLGLALVNVFSYVTYK